MNAINIYKSKSFTVLHLARKFYCTTSSLPTLSAIRARRNKLFTEEKLRQQSLITRLEKIKVLHNDIPEECTVIMNKNVSTPYHLAMHIKEHIVTRSVLALVNDVPWDMHRPLTKDCEVKFLHFQDDDPYLANITFWRTCSFILGYVLETAFKDKFDIELCSFPAPDIKAGNFVHDADIKIDDWKPTQVELDCLSRIGLRLSYEDIQFERLEVDASVALEIFKYNRFKSAQIPAIAAKSPNNTLVLYRMGDHVDISRGPMIANTNLLGRFTVTAFHNVDHPQYGSLTRVQGLAMPKQLQIHYWTYQLLCERAAKLNTVQIFSRRERNRLATL